LRIQIRLAQPSDAVALSDLAVRTFRDTFAAANTAEDMAMYLAKSYSVAQTEQELADPAMATLVAESDGTLIAFAQLRLGSAPPGPETAAPVEIWRFYVDQPWHGRGIAAELMARVESHAADHGAQTLWLGVWEHNARGIAFYRKTGFTDVGEQEFVLGTDVQRDRVMLRPVRPRPGQPNTVPASGYARGNWEPVSPPAHSPSMHTKSPDLDAWTVPPFSQYDGIEGIYSDDERIILDMWSPWHAQRVNVRLPIARARVRAAEWRLANVMPRGIPALVANAEHTLAEAKAEVAELEYKRDLLEASRVRENEWPGWTWA
jgi:ribosomal protein S18 acetylase RimI-like enzyme